MNALELAVRQMTDKYDGFGDRVAGFEKEVIAICEYYGYVLGYHPVAVFEALEKNRTISYPNHYQWANFPKLDDGRVMIFETTEEALLVIQPGLGFICPRCNGKSTNPYVCDSGELMAVEMVCDWKSYGLFGTIGRGFKFLIAENWLENPIVDECFMPVALEKAHIGGEE